MDVSHNHQMLIRLFHTLYGPLLIISRLLPKPTVYPDVCKWHYYYPVAKKKSTRFLIHPISPGTSGHCTSFTHILSSNPLLSLWQVLNGITCVKYLENGLKYCKSTCLSLPLGPETRDYNWSIFKPPESST